MPQNSLIRSRPFIGDQNDKSRNAFFARRIVTVEKEPTRRVSIMPTYLDKVKDRGVQYAVIIDLLLQNFIILLYIFNSFEKSRK